VNRSRRQFVAALSAGALGGSAPRLSLAASMKRVAVLLFLEIDEGDDPKIADSEINSRFIKPFAEIGWRDGVNIKVVPHIVPLASNWDETVPKAVGAVVKGGFDGAIVEGEHLTRRLQQAAPALPIAAYLFDPVGQGFARSLSRPGGTVTGSHRGVREVFLKQIDTLRRLVPQTTCMGWISFRPQLADNWPAFAWAAGEVGIAVKQVLLEGSDPTFPRLAGDFETLRRGGCRCAHLMGGVPPAIKVAGALAIRHRIAMSFWGHPADLEREGMLLQYRPTRDGVEARLCAVMARILRGQHPRDIPFEGPTTYQLRINLKTAEKIGVKVPNDVLVMMDEVLR
jgi:putative tryptophan/tyrosine transport system substrate-binding protein